MIPTGTELTITAEKTSSQGSLWGKTEYNGLSGWIYLPATTQTDTSGTAASGTTSSGSAAPASGTDLTSYLGMSMSSVLSALPGSYGYSDEDNDILYEVKFGSGIDFSSSDGTAQGTVSYIDLRSSADPSYNLYGVNGTMSVEDAIAVLQSEGWTYDSIQMCFVRNGRSVYLTAANGNDYPLVTSTSASGTLNSIIAFVGMPTN